MNSSLAYTANERVERYRKSVEFIAEDVLLYKGFLGRTLKERNGLPTVGARAARAAGVIVDSLGKLRCPPGTPNANQFTDLQMSNCMVPGLGTARRLANQAAQSTQNLLRQARNMVTSPATKKRAKGVAKVAALASLVSLDTLDYLNVDGSGSLSASTLALAEVLRYGSSTLAQAALDRLQRRGKITPNQRKNMDAILEKLGQTDRFFGVAEYLTGRADDALRRRRRMKPTRRENLIPNVVEVADDALDEIKEAQWLEYLESLNIPDATVREKVKVETVEEAVVALLEGKIVDMPDVEGAHTLMDELGHILSDLEDMHKKGEIDDATLENAVFDLCQITVKGTSAFCLGNKGIPRYMMPQAAGNPVSDSKAQKLFDEQKQAMEAAIQKAIADGLPQDEINKLQKKLNKFVAKNEVDGTADFLRHLASKGIKPRVDETGKEVGTELVPSTKLKATQRDMQGHKVVGMMRAKKLGEYNPGKDPVFVSSDGYIIDGHHRVGAQAAMDFQDGVLGNDHEMPVIVLDAPISEILREANIWTEEFGIAKKDVAQASEGGPTPVDILELVKQKRAKQAQDALGKVDNRIPDVDLTPNDLGQPKPDAANVAVDLLKPTLKKAPASSGYIAGAPPEFSARPSDKLTQVTADADALTAAIAQKKQNLLNKYVPGKENEPVESYADELMQKMGVITDKPFKEQLDDAMNYFMKTGEADAEQDLTFDRNLSHAQNEVNRIRGTAKKEAWELTKTEEGKKQVREAMAQGYLEVLVGAELSMENNPSIRNATEMRIHTTADNEELSKFAGYAQTMLKDDGTVSLVCTLVPSVLPFDSKNVVGPDGSALAKGQSLSTVFRFAGAEDYQMGLGVHEYAHLEHFASQFASVGLQVGRDAPPLSRQMDGSLGDSIIGTQFARSHNFPTGATWDEVRETFKKSRGNDYDSREIASRHKFNGVNSIDQQIYSSTERYVQSSRIEQQRKEHNNALKDALVAKQIEETLNLGLTGGTLGTEAKVLGAMMENLHRYDREMDNPFAGMNPNNLTEEQKRGIISQIKMNSKAYIYELVDAETGKELGPDDVRKILADIFEGQTPQEFLATHKKVMDEVLGIDSDYISTNGVPTDEVMSVLARASEYGGTNMMEAIAEARTLTTLAERFPDSISVKQMEDVERMREMLNRVIPDRSGGVARRNLTPEAKEHFARIARMLGSLPALKLGKVRI